MGRMFGVVENLNWLEALRARLGDKVQVAAAVLQAHAQDETEDLRFPPDAVVSVQSREDVVAAMEVASAFGVPVTPAGARTGLSGGALAVNGGIALSLKEMGQILDIDLLNQQVRVQPGVIVQELQEAVQEHGLFYAVDPASRGTCTIGGNLAENSGGPRAVKYGVTKDWVLNLEVVLPTGQILRTGADTLKNSTGYNLTQLLVGSEGTLGVITEATLKLQPWPRHNALLLVPFPSAEAACAAVAAVFQAGVQPSAMEFMERDAVLLAQAFTGDHSLPMPDDVAAHLLIEVDGFRFEDLAPQIDALLPVLESGGAGDIWFADDAASKEKLWFLRRRMGEAVKARSVYKEEDTVVPRGRLPELLRAVKEIGARTGFSSICYGHAGDGNLHVNILQDDLSNEQWEVALPGAIRELFAEVVRLGGTISGEHGIGYVQRPFVDLAFSPAQIALQRAIKSAFDPHGILNPNKILP